MPFRSKSWCLSSQDFQTPRTSHPLCAPTLVQPPSSKSLLTGPWASPLAPPTLHTSTYLSSTRQPEGSFENDSPSMLLLFSKSSRGSHWTWRSCDLALASSRPRLPLPLPLPLPLLLLPSCCLLSPPRLLLLRVRPWQSLCHNSTPITSPSPLCSQHLHPRDLTCGICLPVTVFS